MKKNLLATLAFSVVSMVSVGQWVPQSTGFSTDFRGLSSISIVDANTVWAIGYDGTDPENRIQEFTRTTDGGDNWTSGDIDVSSSTVSIAQVTALDGNTAWIAVAPNTLSDPKGIYRTDDGGANWTRQASATYDNKASFPNVVHFWDKDNGICQGDPINPAGSVDPDEREFEIYITSDGGTTWALVDAGNIPDPLYGETGYTGKSTVTANSIWFGTSKGRIYRSNDKGQTWNVSDSPVSDFGNKDINGSFAFTTESKGLLIDNASSIWETTDAGANWVSVTPTGVHHPTDIAAIPGMEGTYVNTGIDSLLGGVSYTMNNGNDWTEFEELLLIEKIAWFDDVTGWVGSFNIDANTGGIYKFVGTVTAVETIATEELNVEVYPNPTEGIFTINLGDLKDVQISILNITGQEVYSLGNVNKSQLEISLTDFSKGVYFVKVQSDNQQKVIELIKQ